MTAIAARIATIPVIKNQAATLIPAIVVWTEMHTVCSNYLECFDYVGQVHLALFPI